MFGRFGSRPYIQNTSAIVEMPSTMHDAVAIDPHFKIDSHRGRCLRSGFCSFAGFIALTADLLVGFWLSGELHIRKVLPEWGMACSGCKPGTRESVDCIWVIPRLRLICHKLRVSTPTRKRVGSRAAADLNDRCVPSSCCCWSSRENGDCAAHRGLRGTDGPRAGGEAARGPSIRPSRLDRACAAVPNARSSTPTTAQPCTIGIEITVPRTRAR